MVRVLVPVCGGMATRGIVTAPDMPAAHAQAKMHPMPACSQAVLAAGARRHYRFDGVEVRAFGCQSFPLSSGS